MNKTEILNRLSSSDEERLLFARLLDKLTLTGTRDIPCHTDFLSPKERALAEKCINACGRPEHLFYGGWDEAERTICVFLPRWQSAGAWLESGNSPLRALRCFWPKETELTHRDFLGSVLGLGIEREKVVDILVGSGQCDIIVLEDISEFLRFNLLKAGRAHLRLEEISINELQPPQKRIKIIKDTVPSLRLDAVAASGFSLSRARASELISSGRVQLNHIECVKPDRTVSQGDTVSCRGCGKFVLKQAGGTSKKGRIIIEIERYV